MSALTPTQRGIKLRLAASRERSAGHDDTADMIEELADQIDPKPEYPDGTIAWITYGDYPRPLICVRAGDRWAESDDQFGRLDEESVTKVEPLRVLGDDEIALPRSAFGIWQTATHARHRAQSYVAGSATADIWRAYADALRAEEGDRR